MSSIVPKVILRSIEFIVRKSAAPGDDNLQSFGVESVPQKTAAGRGPPREGRPMRSYLLLAATVLAHGFDRIELCPLLGSEEREELLALFGAARTHLLAE